MESVDRKDQANGNSEESTDFLRAVSSTQTPSREELVAMVARARKRRIEKAIQNTQDARITQLKQ